VCAVQMKLLCDQSWIPLI